MLGGRSWESSSIGDGGGSGGGMEGREGIDGREEEGKRRVGRAIWYAFVVCGGEDGDVSWWKVGSNSESGVLAVCRL